MDVLKIVGVGGKSILCKDGKVKLVRVGGLFTSKREKIIPAGNIMGVEVKAPGALYKGYIQIQLAGQRSSNSSHTLDGGTSDALMDENAVVFTGAENCRTAKKIQQHILDFNAAAKGGVVSATSAADEILKFKALFDDGIITHEEFEAKKACLLKK